MPIRSTSTALELAKLESRVASAALATGEAQGRLSDIETQEANQYRDFVRSQITLAGNQIIFPKPILIVLLPKSSRRLASKKLAFLPSVVSCQPNSQKSDRRGRSWKRLSLIQQRLPVCQSCSKPMLCGVTSSRPSTDTLKPRSSSFMASNKLRMSTVRKVSHLLVQIVASHGMVLKKPPPAATLTEFAERGLLFTVTYWLDITATDPVTVASDLRQMIANQLSDNGMPLSNIPVDLERSDAAPGHAAASDRRPISGKD
jgi:hypothetical protein